MTFEIIVCVYLMRLFDRVADAIEHSFLRSLTPGASTAMNRRRIWLYAPVCLCLLIGDAAAAKAGKPYRGYISVGAGGCGRFDADEQSAIPCGKDYFVRAKADVSGRLLEEGDFSLWSGIRQDNIHYPDLNDRDYTEEGVYLRSTARNLWNFDQVTLRYDFNYAEQDYTEFRTRHHVDTRASISNGPSRIQFGFSYGQNLHFEDFEHLDGPQSRVSLGWKRKLPLWQHHLQLITQADCRQTQAQTSDSIGQQMLSRYRARIWGTLYGHIQGLYRRDAFVNLPGVDPFFENQTIRVDHRIDGDVRFDLQLGKHLKLNWGYRWRKLMGPFSSAHHQIDSGFAVSF